VHIAGVDEAGRGCLAGPVVAAAVILNPARPIAGLADSKKLSAKQREKIASEIRAHALCFAVGLGDVAEIDAINILQSSLCAMARAVNALSIAPHRALIDGTFAPQVSMPCTTIIGGDASEPAISATSIIAKTYRDALLVALDAVHPGYGLAKHKGYGTALHMAALQALGPIAGIHRMSYAPVRAAQFAKSRC
jgi:ribonuclease HII